MQPQQQHEHHTYPDIHLRTEDISKTRLWYAKFSAPSRRRRVEWVLGDLRACTPLSPVSRAYDLPPLRL